MTKSKKDKELNLENQETPRLTLKESSLQWEGAYPYTKEIYIYGNETIITGVYYSGEDSEYNNFLFKMVRDNACPTWIKNNFQLIKKEIRSEIKHRKKKEEKLSKELKQVVCTFFKDSNFFNYDEDSEFFTFEEDTACVNFLKATFDTKFYETFVKQGQKRRKEIMQKYGRI